jgi:predicted DNA-binding antitoxin AbrB/MazE fold protein
MELDYSRSKALPLEKTNLLDSERVEVVRPYARTVEALVSSLETVPENMATILRMTRAEVDALHDRAASLLSPEVRERIAAARRKRYPLGERRPEGLPKR